MKRALLLTLGCKLNQAEMADLAAVLAQNGIEILYDYDNAGQVDVIIVNTCAVTERAEAKSRQLLAKMQRIYPNAKIISVGCAVKYNPYLKDIFSKVDFLDSTGGLEGWLNKDKYGNISELIVSSSTPLKFEDSVSKVFNRTRPLVKIQDGCDNFCSFCVIPLLRGSQMRSKPLYKIINEVEYLVNKGFEEVNLTGVRIGSWGKDLNPPQSLYDLCRALIDIKHLRRVRLGSIEPWELDDNLLSLVSKNEKVAPHLHIPLQHTVEHILKEMNRPPLDDLLYKLSEVKQLNPNLALGIDVIVGFPTECEADFNKLYGDLKNLPLTYLHAFGFSPRRGTSAALWKNINHSKVIKERVAKLRGLGKIKKEDFYRSQIGKLVWAIPEMKNNRVKWSYAVTENYLKLLVPPVNERPGKALKYKIEYKDGNYIGIPLETKD